VREINVSCAGDPVHAGDKALTRETPAKRGRVNRYDIILTLNIFQAFKTKDSYLLVGAGNDKQFKLLCKVSVM
jgi:crotonobetainyl-CoA:carnitine CoA-transferase CaiB-like acyl-CoA transferase